MTKLAHKTDDGRVQPLCGHLRQTAEIAERNAVGMFKPLAHAIGLAHDIGKYAQAFQDRLNGSAQRFEHSVGGAMEYKKLMENDINVRFFAPMFEFCIACHHTGLQDGGSLRNSVNGENEGTMNARISDKRRAEFTGEWDYSSYKDEIRLELPDFSELLKALKTVKSPEDAIELYAFFTRYLFSCLVDADFIDTERVFAPETERGFDADFQTPSRRLDGKFAGFNPETELQKARSRVQEQAYQNAKNASQISILNLPTGSGKTLCSLKLALDKVNADRSKRRIIYVIPYTGIIEQTAAEFESIFDGCARILQHHSNYSFDEIGEDVVTSAKLKRAAENWDVPIVITTIEQFFESFYHYKSSALRKVHNMANAIIVFDEVHTLPVECLQPCLRAVGCITEYLNSEAIFLSATMPDYSELFKKYAPSCKISHLVADKSDFEFFKKARFVNLGNVDYGTICERSSEYGSSLIITNTKKSAREIFAMLTGNKYHLSTFMTPYDRSKTIAKIKAELAEGKQITVVSHRLSKRE